MENKTTSELLDLLWKLENASDGSPWFAGPTDTSE
jgi:hypothetical protein